MFLPPFLQRWLLLNALRLLTITSCALVIAATIRTLKINFEHYPPPLSSHTTTPYYPSTDIPTTLLGVFWSTLHHVSLILVLFTVILSELSLPLPLLNRLFKNTLPFLGPNWGLGFLGVLLLLVAADGLSRADRGVFAEAGDWVLACSGVVNVVAGVVWRAKAKVVRGWGGWKVEVAERLEGLAEAKARAERVVEAVTLPTTEKGDGEGGGVGGNVKSLLGMAGKAVSKKMEERQARKAEQQEAERDVEKTAAQPEAPAMEIFTPPLPSAIVSSRAAAAPASDASTASSATSSPKKTPTTIPPPLLIPPPIVAAASPPLQHPQHSRASTSSSISTSSVYTLDIPPHPAFSGPTPVLTTTDTSAPSPSRSFPSKPTLKTVRFHPTYPHVHDPSPIPSLSTSVEVSAGGSRFLMLPTPSPSPSAGVMEGERSPSVLASLKAAMLEAQAKASQQPCKKSLYLGSSRWRKEYENLASHSDSQQEEAKDKVDDRPYDFL